METQTLDYQEQLNLIHNMISVQKKNLSSGAIYFLIWGWAVFICALIQYVCIELSVAYNGIAWAILLPLALIITIVISLKQNKRQKSKTWLDKAFTYLWVGLGIAFVGVIFISPFVKDWLFAYPFIMILYGIGTFISGGLLNFKPLIIGGLISFACGFVSFFLTPEQQLLAITIAVLCSYIIPGHILAIKGKKK